MRQHLTKEELNEIDKEEQDNFIKDIKNDYTIFPWELFTIGKIWEVLEDKIECIFAQSEKGTWVIDIKDRASLPKQFEDKEPIIALWKAYKFTLTI